jgi:hypothetical protein
MGLPRHKRLTKAEREALPWVAKRRRKARGSMMAVHFALPPINDWTQERGTACGKTGSLCTGFSSECDIDIGGRFEITTDPRQVSCRRCAATIARGDA